MQSTFNLLPVQTLLYIFFFQVNFQSFAVELGEILRLN